MIDNREIIQFLINSNHSKHYFIGIPKTNSVRQSSEFFEGFAQYEKQLGALINYQRDLEKPRPSDALKYLKRCNNEKR